MEPESDSLSEMKLSPEDVVNAFGAVDERSPELTAQERSDLNILMRPHFGTLSKELWKETLEKARAKK